MPVPVLERLEERTVPSSFIQFQHASYGAAESNGFRSIALTRTGVVTGEATVVFATRRGTAEAGSDYLDASVTLAFAPGQTFRSVDVQLLADSLVEGLETVHLALSNPVGAELGAQAAAELYITDPVPAVLTQHRLFADAGGTTPGLTGSYVNQSLRAHAPQDDWRQTQVISGTRLDPAINFSTASWGSRAAVGVTGGTDADWNNFSVQWDGFVEVLGPQPARLKTRSDDGSRLWIDINGDGVFASSGPEFLDNGWGTSHTAADGAGSPALAPGVYRVRIQYEEGTGGNTVSLLADPPELVRAAYLIPVNRAPQPQAVANLQSILRQYQVWYREQMDRNGFGPRTFHLETLPDGVTPRVHVVFVSATDETLRADLFNQNIQAARNAGIPVLQTPGQNWLLVSESHLLNPDGSILGHTALGASNGSGSDPGVGVVGSDVLPLLSAASLGDDRTYDGANLPKSARTRWCRACRLPASPARPSVASARRPRGPPCTNCRTASGCRTISSTTRTSTAT